MNNESGMNPPRFKIYGDERKKLKKERSLLASQLRMFWHFHQMDKDMALFYGHNGSYPMSDENAETRFNEISEQIRLLDEHLIVPYTQPMGL